MFDFFDNLSEQTQGVILLFVGGLFLLYILGVCGRGFTAFVFIVGAVMLATGLAKLGVVEKVRSLFKKK